MEKRGPLASDAAMTDEIIREADASDDPVFFFAVSLQNHGPYEPNRYYNPTHTVQAPISQWARESLLSYAEGSADADRGLEAADRMGQEALAADGHRLLRRPSAAARAGLCRDRFPEGQCRAAQGADAGRRPRASQTPLVIWSNRSGPVEDIGAVSPAFLPYHILTTAGITHPYYTGFLGEMREHYRVVDRNLLLTPAGEATPDWSRQKEIDPAIRDFRLIQYDMMFGKRHAAPDFFPETVDKVVAHTS